MECEALADPRCPQPPGEVADEGGVPASGRWQPATGLPTPCSSRPPGSSDRRRIASSSQTVVPSRERHSVCGSISTTSSRSAQASRSHSAPGRRVSPTSSAVTFRSSALGALRPNDRRTAGRCPERPRPGETAKSGTCRNRRSKPEWRPWQPSWGSRSLTTPCIRSRSFATPAGTVTATSRAVRGHWPGRGQLAFRWMTSFGAPWAIGRRFRGRGGTRRPCRGCSCRS